MRDKLYFTQSQMDDAVVSEEVARFTRDKLAGALSGKSPERSRKPGIFYIFPMGARAVKIGIEFDEAMKVFEKRIRRIVDTGDRIERS